jgi:glycosyltransferase involved in cell wall biosynthesis
MFKRAERKAMKVSIITAVYNRENCIASAMRSVQNQSYPDIEHVIQDGGSKDGTLKIVKALSNSATRLSTQDDNGIYDGINRGIDRATGEIIGVMHSDDQYANNEVVKKVVECFKTTSVDGVYGDLEYVAERDINKVVRYWRAGTCSVQSLKNGWMPPHPTLFLRKSVYEQFGKYDTSYGISADYDAMLRFIWRENIKFTYLPEVLIKMRLGGVSNKSVQHIFQKSKEDYFILKKNNIGGIKTLLFKNLRKLKQFVDCK